MPVRSGYGPSVSFGLTTHEPDVVVVPVPVDVPPLPVLPVDGLVGAAEPQPAIAAPPTAVSAPRICRRLKRELLFFMSVLYECNSPETSLSRSRHTTSPAIHNSRRRGRCFGELDLMTNFDAPVLANGASDRRTASLTSVLIAGLS